MANFDLSKYITIGRYVKGNSPIHQMDPRTKIVCFILWVLTVSVVPSIWVQFGLVICVVMMFLFSDISLGYGMSGIRPLLPVLVVILLFEIFFARSGPTSHTLLVFGWFHLTTGGLWLAGISIARFLSVIWLVSLLTLTTSLSSLTHALGELLKPLNRLRIPTDDIVMVCLLAVRFVPILTAEAERLMKAQAARGAEFGTARWWQLGKRVKSVLPILIPLFVGALRRTETVAMAMEVRGYRPGKPRSSYIQNRFRQADAWFLAISIVFVAISVSAAWLWHTL